MDLLILGGTRFLGRVLVEIALSKGHKVTLFNRGKSNPDLFTEVERLTGDRTGDLSALQGRRWDAVIDTSGYEPGVVQRSAETLANAADRYIFISTLSVYADPSQPGIDEAGQLAQLPEGEPETFKPENYGALKALCEQAAERAIPGRVLIIRPGLIVGEYDPTDRFTYWPWRIAQGGEVLAPGRPEHLTQFIDVRDLAGWTIRMMERQETGIYNATGLDRELTMGELLETCQAVSAHAGSHSSAHLNWISETFLLENHVEPWSELPLWLPESDPTYAGFDRFDIRKALNAGLAFRPLEDTIRSTLAWADTFPADHAWKAGLSREREAELLAKAGR